MGIASDRPELTEKGLQFILMGIASDFVICEIIEKILQIILMGVVVRLKSKDDTPTPFFCRVKLRNLR